MTRNFKSKCTLFFSNFRIQYVESLINFKTGPLSVRAFYTSERILAGSEIFWDYYYHKVVKAENGTKKCSCGKGADCNILNRKDGYDYPLEHVIKHIGKNSSGNRRYFVKWLGFDGVNNSWADETELNGNAKLNC